MNLAYVILGWLLGVSRAMQKARKGTPQALARLIERVF